MAQKSGLAQIAAEEAAALAGHADEWPDTPDLFGDARPATRGRGRPAGAQNRKSRTFRDIMGATGFSPAYRLMEIARAPLRDLAGHLGMDKADAAEYQMDALKALLPYELAKPAIQVETRNAHVIVAVEQIDGDPNAGRVMTNQPVLPTLTLSAGSVENQSLSEAVRAELETGELEE